MTDEQPKNNNERHLRRMRHPDTKTVYIAIWKGSKDPKIEILFKKPDREKWKFVKCKVLG